LLERIDWIRRHALARHAASPFTKNLNTHYWVTDYLQLKISPALLITAKAI